jgi:RNA polymerase sigma-70 factor, ECF subfamily
MTPALHSEIVARERPHLVAVAYRMLGSRGEAEDVVQEALTRLPHDAPDSPRAYLTTVVTRLCLDELKSARRRRETYVGPWLPEPWTDAPSPEDSEAQRSEASLALLLVLEQLSPRERVVFVLRELVDCEFFEIAQALGASEQSCRKLLSRARQKVQLERHLSMPDRPAENQLAMRFFAAAASGDVAALVAMLAPEATLTTDHGGKASAARNVLSGANDVARFLAGIARKGTSAAGQRVELRLGNGGLSATVFAADGRCEALVALDVTASATGLHVERVLCYRNPDKLARVV